MIVCEAYSEPVSLRVLFRDNRDVSVWIIEMPKSAFMFSVFSSTCSII